MFGTIGYERTTDKGISVLVLEIGSGAARVFRGGKTGCLGDRLIHTPQSSVLIDLRVHEELGELQFAAMFEDERDGLAALLGEAELEFAKADLLGGRGAALASRAPFPLHRELQRLVEKALQLGRGEILLRLEPLAGQHFELIL